MSTPHGCTEREELLRAAVGAASGQLELTVSEGVGTIAFTRPEKRNAISFEMWSAFARIMPALAGLSEVDVVVLRGTTGGHFSAGADIAEFTTLRSDIDGARRYNDAVEAGERAIIEFPRTTVAAVQGYAIGGGAQVALACDLRLCDPTARFAITPAKLGLVYGLASTRRLVETVGPAWARWILFTGRQLDAETSLRIGLVHEVHEAEEFGAVLTEVTEGISSLARGSIEGSKEFVAGVAGNDTMTAARGADIFDASIRSPEYSEGVRAFLDKRTPDFRAARRVSPA
jgi:enoyl-CoA hydratase/carnithine racemase